MSDIVNAEVVANSEHSMLCPEQWLVCWVIGGCIYREWFGSKSIADKFRGALSVRHRIIRIPAEGEEHPRREAATRDEIKQCAARDCADTMYQYEKAWRAAERHHGIGASDATANH